MRTNFGDYRAKMDKDEKKFKLGKSEIGSIFIDLCNTFSPSFEASQHLLKYNIIVLNNNVPVKV